MNHTKIVSYKELLNSNDFVYVHCGFDLIITKPTKLELRIFFFLLLQTQQKSIPLTECHNRYYTLISSYFYRIFFFFFILGIMSLNLA